MPASATRYLSNRSAMALAIALALTGCMMRWGSKQRDESAQSAIVVAESTSDTPMPSEPLHQSQSAYFSPTAALADASTVLASGPEIIEPAPEQDFRAEQKGKPADSSGRLALFREWPKTTPDGVIVFSGQQHGYLEPCGCSPEFQKGGLPRRLGLIRALAKKNWPLLMVDIGGVLDDHSQQKGEGKYYVGQEQAQAKLEIALEGLQQMGYAAIGIGPEDIAVPNGFFGLMGLLINLNDPPHPRGLNANLGIDEDFIKEGLFHPVIVRQVGKLHVAVTAAVAEKYKDRMSDPVLEWQPPDEVLPQVLGRMKQAHLKVLALYGDVNEAKRIAEKFPELDVILHASEAEEPPGRAERVGRTMLATIGTKGKYTGVIGVFQNSEPRTFFELVPLDDRFPEDKRLRELLDVKYIDKLRELNLVERQDHKRLFDPSKPELSFVGSEKCGVCHPKVYEFWKTTRHAHALDTLVDGYSNDKGKHVAAGKHVNPECISCHVTGFLYQTGYDGTDATKHLGGNGCENCHGPGSEHVRVYMKLNPTKEEERLANSMVRADTPTAERNFCVRCHDAENDPAFDLDIRWTDVEHGIPAGEDQKLWPSIREKLHRTK